MLPIVVTQTPLSLKSRIDFHSCFARSLLEIGDIGSRTPAFTPYVDDLGVMTPELVLARQYNDFGALAVWMLTA